MSPRSGEILHVLGVAAPGDPATAAARALRDRLADEGRPGRVAALDVRGSDDDIVAVRAEDLDGRPVVVHSVDGGEALAPLLPELCRATPRLVHHGSQPGSNRDVLRSFRGAVTAAVAGDPIGREELRALGFPEPAALPAGVMDGALVAATTSVDGDVGGHPGPHLLAVGPLGPGRSQEALVDAFAELLRTSCPSAVLTICGPATAEWYRQRLLSHVVRRGLAACEVIEPRDERTVLHRLQRCDVFVAIRPSGLDPYLCHAAGHARVVAPRSAATAAFAGGAGFVELAAAASRDELVRALRQAVSIGPPAGRTLGGPPPGPASLRELLQVA